MVSDASATFTASRPSFTPQHLKRVLIANRGEIALRLIRACHALGLETVAIYSAEDAGAPHVAAATRAVLIPGRESDTDHPGGYLSKTNILKACKDESAQAILPGYGFLSENAALAKMVEEAGIVWCGPSTNTIADFGSKHAARDLALKAGVPIVPGSGLLSDSNAAKDAANKIGYPVMLKASSGGGGMGLLVCNDEKELVRNFETVRSRSQALYGDALIFLEKYIADGRHIEVQIFGNGKGDVVHFGERECSIQRRHQKVVEEAPSPYIQANPILREKMTKAAVDLGRIAAYRSAGTVEFIVSDATGEFYYLESNCRLQVEHPVTEQVWDIDLVALMLQQADAQLASEGALSGAYLASLQTKGSPSKASIEVRLYAEDPVKDYLPSPGPLQLVRWPEEKDHTNIRLESWISTGTQVSASYDPLLAKILATAEDRESARKQLHAFLSQSQVLGTRVNLDFLADILDAKAYKEGHTLTSFLTKEFTYRPQVFEVLSKGFQTSVQDLGRKGVGFGVPESGAMDPLHLKLANVLAGNPQGTEALEIVLVGPHLKFHAPAVISIAGPIEVDLDGQVLESYSRFSVQAGSVLKLGRILNDSFGCRAYLAIKGGLPSVAPWLGSKSTSASLGLGGYQGRDLAPGDVLQLPPAPADTPSYILPRQFWPIGAKPDVTTLLCMRGPYDIPEYVHERDAERLYGEWTVSAQSARSGIRLEGPRLEWARKDGGEGGSHPSNVLEIPYPAMGINWNGDTPVILGPDGPDLGGLLITHTVISSEWRVGQIQPGDKLRFQPISFRGSQEICQRQDVFLEKVAQAANCHGSSTNLTVLSMAIDDKPTDATLEHIPSSGRRPSATILASGDRFVTVEFGEHKLDLTYRSQIEVLNRAIDERRASVPGLSITNPNMRSMSLQFNPRLISQQQVTALLKEIIDNLAPAAEIKIPNREFLLPISFDDPTIEAATKRYADTVRSKAAYLPSNKEYLRRANGMKSLEDVESVALDSSLLVVGLGFFLGTPILVPVDPRKRITSQKYNPTRTYTSRGTVGHGGSAFAIYGVDSPGGYQIYGRTLPSWDSFTSKPGFANPWLFRAFDTIKFEKVSQQDFEAALQAFDRGTYEFKIKDAEFDVGAYVRFETSVSEETRAFRAKQQVSLSEVTDEEGRLFAEWTQEQEKAKDGRSVTASSASLKDLPNAITASAHMNANVWKVLVKKGDHVTRGSKIAILEAMKTEQEILAPEGMDVIAGILVNPGDSVRSGDPLIVGLPK